MGLGVPMKMNRRLCAWSVNSVVFDVSFMVFGNDRPSKGRSHPRIRITELLFLLFGILPILGITPSAAHAQVSAGSIGGTVRSDAGSVIVGAEITITQVTSGSARTLVTNSEGVFYVPDLSPGPYEMRIAAPGFIAQLWIAINVDAGVPRIFNPVMQAGDSQQTVRVVAPPALVTETCTSACGNVNSSTVSNTPINGRDWAQLATLQAGVTGVQANGGNSDRGFGAPISISGSRPDQNSFRLDAVSINDFTNGAPGSVLGDNLGIDAVDQVSVLGSNYPAEYGRTSGGMINAVTKSGTNGLHGTVYEFLRNSALDARNVFDGPTVPSFRRNQFGGSAGMPIRKGRTFVFGDYEGLRQSLGVTSVDKVPSIAARAGNLSTGMVTVDPAVAQFINAFYPVPNGPLIGAGDTAKYTFAAQQITMENYFTIRLDHKLSNADSFSGTYMRDNSKTNSPDSFGELFSDKVVARQVVALHETHVFSPTVLNAFTFGFGRDVGTIGKVTTVNNPNMNDHTYAFQPGGFAGRIQNVPGVTNFGGAPLPNGFVSSSRVIAWNSFQAGDDMFVTHGIHLLKFGGNVERMQDNQLSNGDVNGSFTFSSLKDFLTNVPQAYSGTIGLSQPVFGMRQTLFGAYVQDDMKLQKYLTFNAGLRYEMVTVPGEAHNRIANLHSLSDALPVLGSPFFKNPTLRNFEPRLGFAWNPKGGKTLIRGGFGVFDVLPLPYEFTISIQSVLPYVHQIYQNVLPAGSFPTGAYQEFNGLTSSSRAFFAEPNPKRNYVMQWNLSVAQELSSTLAVTLGYVGSRGVHQPYRVDNIDMVLPARLTSAGYLWPCGPDGMGHSCASGYLPDGTPAPTVNPNYGRISAALWQANSSYDALQANVTKRMGHGFTFTGAYTWGKSIDTLSSTEANDAFPNGLFNQLYFDQSTTRGLSDFNVAQTFVFNLTWEIPTPGIDSSLAKTALGGWQLGALYKVSTGQPFTPIMGGDPVGMHLEETGLRPSRSNAPGCQSLVNPGNPNNYIKVQCLTLPFAPNSFASQCAAFPGAVVPPPGGSVYCANLFGNLGRNTLIGPGLAKLDLSVFKNNHVKRISETFNAQFRAEFFNILNRANFASPTDNLAMFDQSGTAIPSAGLIDSTQTTSRQIQIALKLIW
jgi:hypothetical protein